MPATPTSLIRATQSPSAAEVMAASSATGRSLVPAVTISTVPVPRDGGSVPATYAVRPTSLISTLGMAARRRSAASGWSRVTSTPFPRAAIRVAMASTCSAVFPAPYTTSGKPCLNARWWSIVAKPNDSTGSYANRVSAASTSSAPAATCSSRSRVRSRLAVTLCGFHRRVDFRVNSIRRQLQIALAAREVRIEDPLHFAERRDSVQLLPQLRRAGQAFHVPPQVLSELDRGTASIGLVLLSHSRVLHGHRKARLHGRRRAHLAALEQVARLIEDPRLAERAASNHDARAARHALHAHRVLRRLDVAVPQHRDLERRDHGRDLLPPRRAAVHLRARARVEREHARPSVLHTQRDADGIAHLLVPSAPRLHGDGQMRRTRNGADDLLDQIQVPETSGAAIALDDLLDRAAKVDVDDFGLEDVRDERGRLGHWDWIGAKDLHADRPLVRAEAQLGDGRLVLPPDALGGQELSDDHVRAKAAADAPEGGFRHAGHRRQVQRHRGSQRERKA